jgi:hypothetical protein
LIPLELLVLPPLAIAAGIDLYLTLLFISAAPTVGLWALPLPGALGDLDSPGILIMVGTFFVLEFAVERFPPAALVWNAFHAIIRPLSGILLALLLLDGQPLAVTLPGSILAGALAFFAHGVRSGGAVVRWLGTTSPPSVLLVSLAEDVVALGLVALALGAPLWASGGAVALLVTVARPAPSLLRAFRFASQLAIGRVFQTLHQRRWRRAEELPEWVRASLEDDTLAPGGALRGSRVGTYRLDGAPRFAIGWVVVREGGPMFVYRRRWSSAEVDLSPLHTTSIFEGDFFRRVDFDADDRGTLTCLFFGLSGPSAENLRAEFLFIPA